MDGFSEYKDGQPSKVSMVEVHKEIKNIAVTIRVRPLTSPGILEKSNSLVEL